MPGFLAEMLERRDRGNTDFRDQTDTDLTGQGASEEWLRQINSAGHVFARMNNLPYDESLEDPQIRAELQRGR